MANVKEFIQNSKPTQFLLVLLVGVAIGAIFYPTKHIEESLEKKHQEEITTLKEQHAKEDAKLQESIDKAQAETKQLHSSTDATINKLTTQIHDLQSKQKTSYYKIVRPDGTVEIKKYTESEVTESTKVITQIQEEFKQKIDAIEAKWETLHKERVAELKKDFDSKEQSYKKEIDELKQTKVVDINKKSFGVEGGMLLDGDYYMHATYDLFGPFFLGLQTQFGVDDKTVGAGIGLRF